MSEPLPSSAPSGRRAVIIALAVAVVLVAIGVATCGAFIGGTAGGTVARLATGNDYLRALQAGDAARAYAYVCDAVREDVSEQEFAAAVAEGPLPTDVLLEGIAIESGPSGDTTELSGTVDVGDVHASVTLVLVADDGGWRVCDVRVTQPETGRTVVLEAVWPPAESAPLG